MMNNASSDDLYAILGVDRHADLASIKRAYRVLSIKMHPDRNPNTPAAADDFRKITDAYRVLSDPVSKNQYDTSHYTMVCASANTNDTDTAELTSESSSIAKLLQTLLFNSNDKSTSSQCVIDHMRVSQPRKPPGMSVHVNVPIENIVHGTTIPVQVCRVISETNAPAAQNAPNAPATTEVETLYVKIPQGADTDEIVVIPNKGCVVNGVYGDVRVFIRVSNNTKFARNGLNLSYIHDITLKDALLGFSFKLRHLNGKTYMFKHTNSIVKPNDQKTIRGLGLSRGGDIGDLVITFRIVFPDKLTDEQKDTIRSVL